MLEFLGTLAAIIAVELLFNAGVNFAVHLLRNVFGHQQVLPDTIKAELRHRQGEGRANKGSDQRAVRRKCIRIYPLHEQYGAASGGKPVCK